MLFLLGSGTCVDSNLLLINCYCFNEPSLSNNASYNSPINICFNLILYDIFTFYSPKHAIALFRSLTTQVSLSPVANRKTPYRNAAGMLVSPAVSFPQHPNCLLYFREQICIYLLLTRSIPLLKV